MPPIESRPNKEPLNQAPVPQGLTPERIAQVTAKFEGPDSSPDALGAGLEEAQVKLGKLAQISEGLSPENKKTLQQSFASKLEAIKESRFFGMISAVAGGSLLGHGFLVATEYVKAAPLNATDILSYMGAGEMGVGALVAAAGVTLAAVRQLQAVVAQNKFNNLNAA